MPNLPRTATARVSTLDVAIEVAEEFVEEVFVEFRALGAAVVGGLPGAAVAGGQVVLLDHRLHGHGVPPVQ